tara:strand:- start:413 stop:532 length:120 start_codon:yes stop_codon:yes gene_type:complete
MFDLKRKIAMNVIGIEWNVREDENDTKVHEDDVSPNIYA